MNRLGRIALAAAVAAGFALAAGCDSPTAGLAGSAPPPPSQGAPPPVRTYDFQHKTVASSKRTSGLLWTVAILRFGDTREIEGQPYGARTQPAQGGQVNVDVRVGTIEADPTLSQDPPQMNKRAREFLKHALVESGCFAVLERERILEILREIEFGKSKFVDPETSPEEGGILCCRYLIEGSLGLNEDRTLKNMLDDTRTYKDVQDYQPGAMENLFSPGTANMKLRLNELEQVRQQRIKERVQEAARARFNTSCYLSVYDVHSGQVIASVMGLGSNGLEAIDDGVEELIDALSARQDGIRVAAVLGEKIYLDVGEKGGVKAGNRYRVIHPGQPLRDRQGRVIGNEETEVAEIEVVEVRDFLSLAKAVQKAGAVARGDVVKPAQH